MTRRFAAAGTALLIAALAAPALAEPAPDPTGGAANDAPAANNPPAAGDTELVLGTSTRARWHWVS